MASCNMAWHFDMWFNSYITWVLVAFVNQVWSVYQEWEVPARSYLYKPPIAFNSCTLKTERQLLLLHTILIEIYPLSPTRSPFRQISSDSWRTCIIRGGLANKVNGVCINDNKLTQVDGQVQLGLIRKHRWVWKVLMWYHAVWLGTLLYQGIIWVGSEGWTYDLID